jgi:hypothetical protein
VVGLAIGVLVARGRSPGRRRAPVTEWKPEELPAEDAAEVPP